MRKAVLTSTKHQLYALSDEEFWVIYELIDHKESYENHQYKIRENIPRLRSFSPEQIKEMYQSKEKKMFFIPNPEEVLTSEEGIQKLIDFINRCPQYLQKKPYPYAIDRKRKEGYVFCLEHVPIAVIHSFSLTSAFINICSSPTGSIVLVEVLLILTDVSSDQQ
ncbi:hypothetical protein M9Y10_007124 [Tritrichomonas musculus]|uniref:Uncharacterized protein n=1 Tax=Tritrichomonas musculus TaxID=1915356 RepID=A0ABR2J0J3_9EUKA